MSLSELVNHATDKEGFHTIKQYLIMDKFLYCNIRPNMVEDALLSQHIKTIDHFFYADL